MLTVFVTVAALALIMGAMAIGVMITGRRLQGSCGGVGSGDCACEAAGVPPEQRACVSANAAQREELVELKR
jgi:hypothetical protein